MTKHFVSVPDYTESFPNGEPHPYVSDGAVPYRAFTYEWEGEAERPETARHVSVSSKKELLGLLHYAFKKLCFISENHHLEDSTADKVKHNTSILHGAIGYLEGDEAPALEDGSFQTGDASARTQLLACSLAVCSLMFEIH